MTFESLDESQRQLLRRPGWSEGCALSASRREVLACWFGAVIWNVLGIPVGWVALFGDRELGGILKVMLPMFTLVGFMLLVLALRETLRWQRFRGLRLELDPLPGSLGGHSGGSIDLPIQQLSEGYFRVLLVCVRDRLTRSKDGNARRQSVQWASEIVPRVERSGRGIRLRFTFQVPDDLPPTEEPSDDCHKWMIRVQGELPGADLDQAFEVPVFRLDTVTEARDPVLSAPSAAQALELPDSVVRIRRGGQSLILHYPVGRAGLAGVMLFVFGAVFAGVGGFMFEQISGMMDGSAFGMLFVAFTSVFLVVFGGLGLLMMFLGVYSMMNSLVVEIGGGRVSTRRRFFFSVSRSARIDEIERVEMDVSSQVGDGAKAEAKVRIRAFLKGGKRLCLGDDIPWGQPAEALAAMVAEELGIPVDFVVRSKPGRR